ncbi:unknown protein [Microcystis aeruginosa NIES-843]|uniref:Uncharacterized protein n=1 Tax=Microcystis aeruginosa (strain NIES-843 / IAM M-2473) TaxID=449447 RepID=B0JQ57_MICAN|nr:unknown protein [Microcystis aeruginosa NIES-843]
MLGYNPTPYTPHPPPRRNFLPQTLVMNSTHLVDFCLTIEMANSPQICLNRG